LIPETFQTKIVQASGYCRVDLSGALDATSEPLLRKLLIPICNNAGQRVVIDASRLSYINSSTFGVFFQLHRLCESQGGRLDLCGFSDKVASILEMLGLHQVLNVFASEEEALADGSGQTGIS
jgi:anti-sigma B factor antagonist